MDFSTITSLGRFRDLVFVLLRYGFDDLVERLDIPGMGFVRKIHRADPYLTPYERIRHALEELGPTFVKFGQIMSLRPDLLPKELILELQNLQDNVTPLPFEEIRPVVEESMGKPLEEAFSRFEEKPRASASLSQVHCAVLKPSGIVVAAKVQRPDIRSVIESDLNILEAFIRRLHERMERVQVYDLPNIVRVTRRTLLRELDFTLEARNLRIARSYLKQGSGITIPKVYLDLCTEKVLLMEYVMGTRLRDVDPASLEHPERIAGNGLRAAIQQILEDGFFHADPHPGNLLLIEGNRLSLIDWGMVGRLTERDRFQLIDLIETVVERDTRRMAEVLLAMAVKKEEVRRSAMERDLLDILDGFYAVPLKQINLGHLLLGITSMLREHRLRMPPDLIIMIKALVTAEGTARGIYPDLDVISEAESHVRRLSTKRYHPRVLMRDARLTASRFQSLASELPGHATKILEKMERGELRIQFEHENLGPLRRTLDNLSNRLTLGIIIGAMIIGSSMIITTGIGPFLFGFPMLGIIGFLISGVLGLWLVFNILRSRRY
ncbi:MAG: AarF/UbiB family protein [Desulfobacteraceae bacterium]